MRAHPVHYIKSNIQSVKLNQIETSTIKHWYRVPPSIRIFPQIQKRNATIYNCCNSANNEMYNYSKWQMQQSFSLIQLH